MENVPVRHYLNPAFQPLTDFYFGLPLLGFSQFGVGNNSLTIKDVVYNDQNGKPIWFLNPNGDKAKFYNTLRNNTLFQTDNQFNLLNFGFRSGTSYWSFSLTEKINGQFNIPKDLLKIALYGTPELENNVYNFRSLGMNMSAYTEAAFGYSKKVNDKWTVGGKFKFLYGTGNISTANQNLDLTAGVEQWKLKGQGSLNIALPGQVQIGDSLESINYMSPVSNSNWYKPYGLGVGIDLGFTFIPINNLTLSAALTDLGMIRWNRNVQNITYNVDYTFTGLGTIDPNTNSIDLNKSADSILTALKRSTTTKHTSTAYTTYTNPKLNIGAEYGFYGNKLSVGLLSRTLKQNHTYYEELTASVNGRPTDWFNMSLAYSILNGKMSNIGAGLGLKTGFVHWFLSADYIPFQFVLLDGNNYINRLPYNSKGFNLAVGVNFVFNNRKDADKDGVIDSKDKCPETPFGLKVDKYGCPIDSDGDNVPDSLDRCPATPPEAYKMVDKKGCPTDKDSDGVADYLDKCPDTPIAAKGFVDKDGCLLDTDSDRVSDYRDKCPNTPLNIAVDSVGCPFDTDGDGVADYLDKSPNTPTEARGKVDKEGRPLDTDGDGIPDYRDNNPNVPDSSINKADIKIKKEVYNLLKKAFQGIRFEIGRDLIKTKSYIILNQIAGVLIANSTYKTEINGYSDNTGSYKINKTLSTKRAKSVRKYLIRKGVTPTHLTIKGYSYNQPAASNKTAAGRTINRRVEFIINYEDISFGN